MKADMAELAFILGLIAGAAFSGYMIGKMSVNAAECVALVTFNRK